MWLSLVTTNDYDHIGRFMQPSDTQLTGVPQQIIIDPNTGLPQNVVIIQQESSAPKIVGILVIIFGSFLTLLTLIALLGVSLITDPDSEIYSKEVADSSGVFYLILLISLACYIAQIVGGAFMTQRKTLGIHIVWIALVGTLIGDIIMNMTYPEYVSSQPGAFSTGIENAISGVCTLICGVIVAIPLMVSGSGMDNSKLFG